MNLPEELVHDLQANLDGEVRTDFTTRLLYSTDASIYQCEPLGVVFPRHVDDLATAVSLAARYGVPVLARGSGSSLAGQAVGPALILDCARHLHQIISLDPESRTAVVEPGVILDNLNRAAATHRLMFGPDPSSSERATLGGSIANNATGAHSILYGMASDHLLAAEVVLADGSMAELLSVSLEEARQRAVRHEGLEARFYQAALEIHDQHAAEIEKAWPHVWRNASGYPLNYLLPWSATRPPRWIGKNLEEPLPYPPIRPGEINLAPLLAGSEGTLAVARRLTLRLVPKPTHTRLAVLMVADILAACDLTPSLLELHPSAVELIPGSLIRLARSVPAYASQLSFIPAEAEAMLAVEFAGDDPAGLQSQVASLAATLAGCPGVTLKVAETPAQQQQVWGVRKVGLALLMSQPGDAKAVAYIEDVTVPVEQLSAYARGIQALVAEFHTTAEFYGHASAGCLHIRPLVNLKTAEGVAEMRQIAGHAVQLALSLGGSVSGEHSVGLARAGFLPQEYGDPVMALFRKLKTAADPHNLLNPGKIIDPPALDENLRYGASYRAEPWAPVMSFQAQAGLDGAVELCNGAGVCRKSGGVMCPSFQATQEEMHSTRGRANLLRAMISGRFPSEAMAEETVKAALDLCLACKGCKAECPSLVDMAKLKYEFSQHYYTHHRRRLRDYLFGYIGWLAPLGSAFAPLVNTVLGSAAGREMFERLFGLAARRRFPQFAGPRHAQRVLTGLRAHPQTGERVLFLSDAFSRYFHPETEAAGRRLLQAAGLQVSVLPVLGAGRTLISKGLLPAAKAHARRLLAAIRQADPEGICPVVAVEPSEIFTLRDEFLDFFPAQPEVQRLGQRAWMVDELLLRPGPDGRPRYDVLGWGPAGPGAGQRVLLHGHCYQKAQPPVEDGLPVGAAATAALLRAAGFHVETAPSGCCGMAGAFGYEAEHYDVSMRVGELSLFPAVRDAGAEVLVAAAGTSCRSQIEDGAGRRAVHPLCLLT